MSNISNEFLDRCRDVTLKSDVDWKTSTQLLRIYENIADAQKSIKSGNDDRLVADCCRIILSTINMLNIMHISHSNTQRVIELCLQDMEKNGLDEIDNITTYPPVKTIHHTDGLIRCSKCYNDIELDDKAVRGVSDDWYHSKCFDE